MVVQWTSKTGSQGSQMSQDQLFVVTSMKERTNGMMPSVTASITQFARNLLPKHRELEVIKVIKIMD